MPKIVKKNIGGYSQIMKNDWLEIALNEIGIKEIGGDGHNPRILEYHQATDLKATTDEVAWCSAYVNWCLKKANFPRTNSAWARSFLNWGRPTLTPKKGDIVVLWRGSKIASSGHVGFFISKTNKFVEILGGNQNNEVNVSKFPIERVLCYRTI